MDIKETEALGTRMAHLVPRALSLTIREGPGDDVRGLPDKRVCPKMTSMFVN